MTKVNRAKFILKVLAMPATTVDVEIVKQLMCRPYVARYAGLDMNQLAEVDADEYTILSFTPTRFWSDVVGLVRALDIPVGATRAFVQEHASHSDADGTARLVLLELHGIWPFKRPKNDPEWGNESLYPGVKKRGIPW